jgi:hypothetical protein
VSAGAEIDCRSVGTGRFYGWLCEQNWNNSGCDAIS